MRSQSLSIPRIRSSVQQRDVPSVAQPLSSHTSARASAGPALLPAQHGAAITGPNYVTVDRNLAMELVRVTEAAALAGGAWLGKVL